MRRLRSRRRTSEHRTTTAEELPRSSAESQSASSASAIAPLTPDRTRHNASDRLFGLSMTVSICRLPADHIVATNRPSLLWSDGKSDSTPTTTLHNHSPEHPLHMPPCLSTMTHAAAAFASTCCVSSRSAMPSSNESFGSNPMSVRAREMSAAEWRMSPLRAAR